MNVYIRKSDGTDERLRGVAAIIQDKGFLSISFRDRKNARSMRSAEARELVLTGCAA